MRTRVLLILVVTALLGASALAELGVLDSKSGIIRVAEVSLGTASNGSASEFQCNMPGNGISWRISEGASSVQFVIHYSFINRRSSSQRFAVGYKVWKQSGSSWILVADSERAVDRAVGANDSNSGDRSVPRLSLSTGGDVFRVTVFYDITGVRGNSTSRTFRVDRSL